MTEMAQSRPPLMPLQHARLYRALRENGFHADREAAQGWVAALATYTRVEALCFITFDGAPGSDSFLVTPSLPAVADAMRQEGFERAHDVPLPERVAPPFVRARGQGSGCTRLCRRVFELSKALPTVPLDRFNAEVRALPARTEAERRAIQRIGQNIFRDALLGLWGGRCAVTGCDQAELLRASHMKPWTACASDAERLDVHNGLLLAAHWTPPSTAASSPSMTTAGRWQHRRSAPRPAPSSASLGPRPCRAFA